MVKSNQEIAAQIEALCQQIEGRSQLKVTVDHDDDQNWRVQIVKNPDNSGKISNPMLVYSVRNNKIIAQYYPKPKYTLTFSIPLWPTEQDFLSEYDLLNHLKESRLL